MTEIIAELVSIPGVRGMLSGRLEYRMDTQVAAHVPGRAAGALILSPHPFMGGHMDLPLLEHISSQVTNTGLPTLRFDYGGVGQSEGEPFDVGSAMDLFWKTGTAPQDPVLIDEARAVLAWFSQQVNGAIVLIGYSFGAFVATQIRDQSTAGIALVAPTITHHDYDAFTNDTFPTLIIAGAGDFATGDEELINWVNALPGPTALEHIRDGDHFFRQSEAHVGELIASFITDLTCPLAGECP